MATVGFDSVAYLLLSVYLLVKTATSLNRKRTRRRLGIAPHAVSVGFFHPFCDAGGGGERVLWRAIHSLSRLDEEHGQRVHVIVYAGDVDVVAAEILAKVNRQFQIQLDLEAVPVSFERIRSRTFLEPKRYPVLTMLGQSLGSILVAFEALICATPDIFFDTTGYAFTFPLAWLAGCRVGAYVHYPTISTDMLSRVRGQRPSYNNSSWVSSNATISRAKLLYYHAFAVLYGIVGAFASVVMVNSSWTKRHIAAVWKMSSPRVVFPPCDTSDIETIPIRDGERERVALSVGQFRPEKDHALQVRAMAELRAMSAQNPGRTSICDGVRLVILGSCRNDDDVAVLHETKVLASELGVSDSVEFEVNCSFEKLKDWLRRASVGLHTMWNEHFGIGVVEMMAAGLVTIAHRSGGPEVDIVVPLSDGRVTGFLAETPKEYAEHMWNVFGNISGHGSKDTLDIMAVRQAGRESAKRFSNEVFDTSFISCFLQLLPLNYPAISGRSTKAKQM